MESQGTDLNAGIPGTGISHREKVSGNNKPRPNHSEYPPQHIEQNHIYSEKDIVSAEVQEITSQNMQGVKESILLAHSQRIELKKEILKVQSKLSLSKFKQTISYILIYGLVLKSIRHTIKSDIEAQKQAIEDLKNELTNCYVNLEIDFDEEFGAKYKELVKSFKYLTTSTKIWDVTSASYQNTAKTRSSAGTVVDKKEVKFGFNSLPDIKFELDALYLKNANGADMYFYPNFIVMYSSQNHFGIIGLDELDFAHRAVKFTETGTIPNDSKVIGNTWAKVNKNGSPDKRFKGNYQIPVVKYGEIRLKTKSGLNEEYEFSNYEYSENFATAFFNYQELLSQTKTTNIAK